MKTVWNEKTIRAEMARLDLKTGLNGAELPISFNNAKCTLGQYCSTNGGSFKFSNYYFQNPTWPIEEALDTIRHEYAHYMDHMFYGHGGHGTTWKVCCGIVGASPIRCYNEERAEYYKKMHKEEDELSKKLDAYKIGDHIEHPKYGIGEIEEISGEGVRRCIIVKFPNGDLRKMVLVWVESNCQKVNAVSRIYDQVM